MAMFKNFDLICHKRIWLLPLPTAKILLSCPKHMAGIEDQEWGTWVSSPSLGNSTKSVKGGRLRHTSFNIPKVMFSNLGETIYSVTVCRSWSQGLTFVPELFWTVEWTCLKVWDRLDSDLFICFESCLKRIEINLQLNFRA